MMDHRSDPVSPALRGVPRSSDASDSSHADTEDMSNSAIDHELSLLSNGDLCELLDRYESEERDVSRRRRELHEQIDALRERGADADGFDLLALERQEQELSSERHDLHLDIGELRREKHRRITLLRSAPAIGGRTA